MIVEALLFLAVLLAYLIIQDRKPKGMPPGPFEIPFFGNHPALEDYHLYPIQKYGPIVTTRFGIRTVVIFDYQLAKEALASLDFVNRPSLFKTFALDSTSNGGLFTGNGEQWLHDRRFALRNLRKLGMEKTRLETAIHTEAQELVEDLKSYNAKAVTFPNSLKTVALNIIWQMLAGKRYDLNSKEVLSVYEALNRFRAGASTLSFLKYFFPFGYSLLPDFFCKNVLKDHLFYEVRDELLQIIDNAVVAHEKTMASEEELSEDFLTGYMLKIKKSQDDPKPAFCRQSMLQSISDMFLAGSDTVFHQIKWTVYYMVKFPEITAMVKKEIDENVPKGQLVSMNHRLSLPLMEAFTNEVLRCASIQVINVLRESVRDTHIRGHFIPQGTIMTVANICIHNDPKYWEHPEQFNPGRFINAEGKYKAPAEGFIAFGAGRRVCVGETLARMESFVFSATLIQNFNIRLPEGAKLNDECESLLGFRAPADQQFIYEYRY